MASNTFPTNKRPVPPDQTVLLQQISYQLKLELNCAKVGIISSYNATTNTATIQLLQNQISSTTPLDVDTIAPYPILKNVPIYFPGGGGYTLTFPIAAGDECVVLFNDIELDNWQVNGGTTTPQSGRVHDLSDGIAFVGIRNQTRNLTDISTTTTQLRSDDGETFIEVNGSGEIITIAAPTQINLNSPIVTVQGIINVVNENSLPDPCIINGTIIATGDIQANNGAISLIGHVHTEVQTGSDNTGPATG